MIRPFLGRLALGVGVTLLMICAGLLAPLQVAVALGLGWASFLIRVLPQVSVDWGGVSYASVCVVLIAVFGHGFGGWLVAQIEPGRRWRMRWTASLLGGVVLMFVAGIAAAGTAHQVGWLLTSKERWVGSSMDGLIRRIQSAKNLRQIGLALQNYEEQNGSLPPAATIDPDGRLLHGWPSLVLPYWESTDKFKQINFSAPWDDPSNQSAIQPQIDLYQNPGVLNQPRPSNLIHYAGNAWVLGGDRAWKLAEITDGTASTMLVGEAAGAFRPWADPNNWRNPKLGINRSPLGFGGPYPGGANFVFADGHVGFLHNGIDQRVFEALCTPSGGEKVSADTD